ncbi:hypothetical protein K2X92_05995 [Candidatus Gracilibacteria bacterium]|nr:hypothetical protein [Candidatus Gracilibacteria bacterium]
MNQQKEIQIDEAKKLQLKELILNINTIGIDIDGTIADTIGAALLEIRNRFGDIMEYSQWKTWNPHQIPELQAQGLTTIDHTIQLFYGILREDGNQIVGSISDSVEGITRLQSFGKELIALSGRMEDSHRYTTLWLNHNFSGIFQKVLLTDHDTPRQIPKYELAQVHGIGLMIEDNAQYAIDLSTHGIPTILIDAPWNINDDLSEYPNIFRVKNWKEIISLI